MDYHNLINVVSTGLATIGGFLLIRKKWVELETSGKWGVGLTFAAFLVIVCNYILDQNTEGKIFWNIPINFLYICYVFLIVIVAFITEIWKGKKAKKEDSLNEFQLYTIEKTWKAQRIANPLQFNRPNYTRCSECGRTLFRNFNNSWKARQKYLDKGYKDDNCVILCIDCFKKKNTNLLRH